VTATEMRTAIVDVHGGLFRVAQIPRPEPGPDQVLVRIHASGVNLLDLKIRAGRAAHARDPSPAILGLDLAGTVEAGGPGVSRLLRGDAVYGMTGGVGGIPGSLAEYAAVDAELLVPKPDNLTMREAAALPLVLITAWEGLVDRAQLQPGWKMLVHGGGGVGHMAIQLATAFGCEIFATESPSKRPIIKGLGASFIDYHSETVASYVARCTDGRGFDLVFDTVGGATLDASFEAVRRHGHVLSCLGWGTHALAPLSFRGATYSGVFTLLPLQINEGRAHHGAILERAARLVEAGKIVPRVDPRSFTLQTVADAHAANEARPVSNPGPVQSDGDDGLPQRISSIVSSVDNTEWARNWKLMTAA